MTRDGAYPAHWQLTPRPGRKCWTKKRKGVSHYVGKGTEKYTEAEYLRAWSEWQAMEKALDQAERDRIDAFHRRLTLEIAGMAEARAKADPEASGLHNEAEHLRQQVAHADEAQQRRLAPKPQAEPEPKGKPPKTLRDLADLFVAHKASQSRKAELSGGRYANLRSHVGTFVEFVGADSPEREFLAAGQLALYYDHLSERVDDEQDLASTTASDKMQVAGQFIRYLWERNYIDTLPRNIASREMVFSRVAGNVEPMPVEVLRRRVQTATGRMKLELLLMANCGMYQKDTADLLHTEIDWNKGTITRKRSKRTKGKEKNLPTVTWYLWPTTLELLKAHANQDSPQVLTNRNGEAGVRTTVRDDGTVARIDNSRTTYDRLQDALAEVYAAEIAKMDPQTIEAKIEAGDLEREDGKVVMRRWPLKHVRKTSATAIGNNRDFSRFAQYFLGQAPETVADTHYIKPSEDQFKACCKWVGEYLELDDIAKIEPPKKPAKVE